MLTSKDLSDAMMTMWNVGAEPTTLILSKAELIALVHTLGLTMPDEEQLPKDWLALLSDEDDGQPD